MIKTVSKIEFLTSKGGHTTAIINGEYSVVRNLEKQPIHTVYKNVANGSQIDSTIDLIIEFSEAFRNHFLIVEKRKQDEQERQRIKEEQETDYMLGTTPQDFANDYDLTVVETASHWNDLYTGRSSFAILINSHEDYRLVQKIAELNNWEGGFGETKHRAGEHHRTFSRYYDLEDYQKKVERYFDENFIYRSQDSEADWFLERIKEAEDMDEVIELTDKFKNLEEGYYLDGWDSPEFEGSDFSNCFGYSYDVYGYDFAYNLPSKEVFYDGVKF